MTNDLNGGVFLIGGCTKNGVSAKKSRWDVMDTWIHHDTWWHIIQYHVLSFRCYRNRRFADTPWKQRAFSTKKHSKAWVCLITQLGEPWDESNCSTMGSSDKNIHPPKAYLFGVRILKGKNQPDSSCLTPGRSWLARSVLRFFPGWTLYRLVQHPKDPNFLHVSK